MNLEVTEHYIYAKKHFIQLPKLTFISKSPLILIYFIDSCKEKQFGDPGILQQ